MLFVVVVGQSYSSALSQLPITAIWNTSVAKQDLFTKSRDNPNAHRSSNMRSKVSNCSSESMKLTEFGMRSLWYQPCRDW
jgi:hypothetical protein